MSVFQVLDHRNTRYGKEVFVDHATGLRPGLLVKFTNAGRDVQHTSEYNKAAGFAFGLRDKIYTPLTNVFADNEELTVLMGAGLALLSADFFTTGSLPAFDACLAPDDDGLIKAVDNEQDIPFGKVVRSSKLVFTYQAPPCVIEDTVMIQFSFDAFQCVAYDTTL